MKASFLFAVGLLAGCAQFTERRDEVVQKAADFNDEALVTSEIIVCRGASVGSIIRRYGTNPEVWEAWKKLCLRPADPSIPPPGPIDEGSSPTGG